MGRRLLWCQLALFTALGGPALTATPAMATSFTWTGEAPTENSGFSNWSNPLNWAGASAPGEGAVGTFDFPQLSNVTCPNLPGPPAFTCYFSHNDVTGISAEELTLDDGHGYQIGGEAIKLGSGGIVAATTATELGKPARLELPLTLTANQTWSIGASGERGDLDIEGPVDGEAPDNVTVELNESSFLNLSSDVEAGDVSISGEGGVSLLGMAGSPSLNGTDGNPIRVGEYSSLVVVGHGGSGPLLPEDESTLQVGESLGKPSTGAAALAVNGEVKLSPGSLFATTINRTGTTAGTDYSQLSATEDVQLAGAPLFLVDGMRREVVEEKEELVCSELAAEDKATLITTTGALSGTFDEVPNGSVVPVECLGEGETPWAKIEYSEGGEPPHEVTATIIERSKVPAPANLAPPTVSGTPKEGETLSVTEGSWANSPSELGDRWEDCDSSGANCQPITGATEQTYTLTSADVGHTIRVSEKATNPGGTSEALSGPTPVVQSKSSGSGGGGSGGGGSGGGGSPGGSGPGSQTAALRIEGGTLHVRQGRVRVRARCLGSGPCKGSATLTTAGKLAGFRLERGRWLARPAKLVLGRGKFSLAGGSSGHLTIRLKPSADRMLRRHRKLASRLSAAGTASGQAFRKTVHVTLEAGRP